MDQNNQVEKRGADFPSVAPPAPGVMAVAQSRAAQEVQGAIVMAKQFPRNQIQAHHQIMESCKRIKLAECAIYSYPKGSGQVEGPSIRLAEVLAQNWGNIQAGQIQLEQTDTETHMMAYAWDLETNTRIERTFTVRHIRQTRSGQTKLDDPRDVYEMCANMGSRRMRACILAIIPGDIIDSAIERINETLKGDGSVPFVDKLKVLVESMASIQVTVAMLEKKLGHVITVTTEVELIQLRKIYMSIRNQQSGVGDWFFDVDANGEVQPSNGGTTGLADKLANGEGKGESKAKPKASKKKSEKAKTKQPEDDLTNFNTVAEAMTEFCSCDKGVAEERITRFVKQVFDTTPGQITDEQSTDLIQKVSAGDLKP